VLCGSVDARRAGEYMAEVRTSSQSERPCAGIEETRKPPGDAGGSSSPVNGDEHTGKRLAGKPHEPFERADGGRAKARPPPTLPGTKGLSPNNRVRWNRIEHRLFAFITQNWSGKPLLTHQVIVQLIASTTTRTGLTVQCRLDRSASAKGVRVSDAEMATLNLQPAAFGDWNYTSRLRQPTD